MTIRRQPRLFAPSRPKIYHIVHMDNLPSIISDGALYSDAIMRQRGGTVHNIGYDHIKERRLGYELTSRPGLHVGECVPFYFCPRSPMLYTLTRGSSQIPGSGDDRPIVHLESDLHAAVEWAESRELRWAFTDVSAATKYFADFADLADLWRIDWDIVTADWWAGRASQKQAEFLVESYFSWEMVTRVGCRSDYAQARVSQFLGGYPLPVEVTTSWYYT